MHLGINRKISIPPHHISMIPLIPVGHLVMWPNTLIEIDESPFHLIEQPSISILSLLQEGRR